MAPLPPGPAASTDPRPSRADDRRSACTCTGRLLAARTGHPGPPVGDAGAARHAPEGVLGWDRT